MFNTLVVATVAFPAMAVGLTYFISRGRSLND